MREMLVAGARQNFIRVAPIRHAAGVLTDPGGLLRETTALGVTDITVREQTERPVIISGVTNRLALWPLSVEGVLGSFHEALAEGRAGIGERSPEGWGGWAAERISDELAETCATAEADLQLSGSP